MKKYHHNIFIIAGILLVILGGIMVLAFNNEEKKVQEDFALNVTEHGSVVLEGLDMTFVLPIDLYSANLMMNTIAASGSPKGQITRDCRQYFFGDSLEPFSVSLAHSLRECIIETALPHAANIANLSREELCDMEYIQSCQSRELPNGWTLVRAYYFSPDYIDIEKGVVYSIAILYGLQDEYYDTIVFNMRGNDTIARDNFQDPQNGEQISSMMHQQDAYLNQLLDTLQIDGITYQTPLIDTIDD